MRGWRKILGYALALVAIVALALLGGAPEWGGWIVALYGAFATGNVIVSATAKKGAIKKEAADD